MRGCTGLHGPDTTAGGRKSHLRKYTSPPDGSTCIHPPQRQVFRSCRMPIQQYSCGVLSPILHFKNRDFV